MKRKRHNIYYTEKMEKQFEFFVKNLRSNSRYRVQFIIALAFDALEKDVKAILKEIK